MTSVQVFKQSGHLEKKLSLLKNCRVCIDANIGAGKTTLCVSLERYLRSIGLKVELSVEDIDTKLKMLELFLNDNKKYAFAFQMMMLSERLNIYYLSAPELSNGRSHIIDRSLGGDLAFALNHHKAGNISNEEMEAYKQFLQKYHDNDYFKSPEYYVYLKVEPEKIMERIQRRNRGSESSAYTEQYIKSIQDCHTEAFEQLGIEFITVDWNQDYELDSSGLLSNEVCASVLDIILRARLRELEQLREQIEI